MAPVAKGAGADQEGVRRPRPASGAPGDTGAGRLRRRRRRHGTARNGTARRHDGTARRRDDDAVRHNDDGTARRDDDATTAARRHGTALAAQSYYLPRRRPFLRAYFTERQEDLGGEDLEARGHPVTRAEASGYRAA